MWQLGLRDLIFVFFSAPNISPAVLMFALKNRFSGLQNSAISSLRRAKSGKFFPGSEFSRKSHQSLDGVLARGFLLLIPRYRYHDLREALFPSVGDGNLVSALFLRKIIDFCEADMEGASPLLPTGSLNF